MAICKMTRTFFVFFLLAASLGAQEQGKNQNQDKNSGEHKRLWVLRAPGEAVEYNPAAFAAMQPVKVPAGAVASPQKFSVNRLGQMLFAAPVALPLAEGDLAAEGKAWFWDGHAATTLPLGGARSTATTGSNLAITESAPAPVLAEDGKHLYWLANQARRLQRDGVDLSTIQWVEGAMETPTRHGSPTVLPPLRPVSIVPNDSEQNRALNRRVQFIRTEGGGG